MKYFVIGYAFVGLVYLGFVIYICWMDFKKRK